MMDESKQDYFNVIIILYITTKVIRHWKYHQKYQAASAEEAVEQQSQL